VESDKGEREGAGVEEEGGETENKKDCSG